MFNTTRGNTLNASRANPCSPHPVNTVDHYPLYLFWVLESIYHVFPLKNQHWFSYNHNTFSIWGIGEKLKMRFLPELWLIFPTLILFSNQTFCVIVNVYFDPLLMFSLRYFSRTFSGYHLFYVFSAVTTLYTALTFYKY